MIGGAPAYPWFGKGQFENTIESQTQSRVNILVSAYFVGLTPESA